jgi:hypothetical protein
MKKIFKLMIVILAVLISVPIAYLVYLQWPRYFPVFKPGTCVVDKKTSQIFRIEGYADNFKNRGVAVRILSANSYTNLKAGETIYIDDKDTSLEEVGCDLSQVH